MASNKWGRFGSSSTASSDDGQLKSLTSAAATTPGGSISVALFPGIQQRTSNTQFDSEIDDIEWQQEQLMNSQIKLMRAQIGSLTSSLSEMREELVRLQGNVQASEVETVLENMVHAHDQHEQNHASLQERVGYLETFIGEVAEKQVSDLADAKSAQEVALDSGFQYLDGLVRDCGEKQRRDLETACQKFDMAISECIKTGQHNQLEEKVKCLQIISEEFTATSKKQFSKHNELVEMRIQNLESVLNMSSKQFSDQAELVESRFESLENMIDAFPKQFAEHGELVEARFGNIETHIAIFEDTTSKQASDLSDTQAELYDILKGYTTSEMYANLVQSLGSLKKSVQTRLDSSDALLQESGAKFARELGELRSRFDSCARPEQRRGLEDRLSQLEAAQSKHDDRARNSSAAVSGQISLQSRVDSLERSVRDSCDKWFRALEDSKAKVQSLEVSFGELAGNLSDASEGAKEHAAMKTRIASLETSFKDSVGIQRTRVLEETKSKLQALERKVNELAGNLNTANTSEQTVIQNRIDFLETSLRDSCEVLSSALEETKSKVQVLVGFGDVSKDDVEMRQHSVQIKNAHSKLIQLEVEMKNSVDRRITALEERYMPEFTGAADKECESSGSLSQRLVALEAGQVNIKKQCEDLDSRLRAETSACDSRDIGTDSQLDDSEDMKRQRERIEDSLMEKLRKEFSSIVSNAPLLGERQGIETKSQHDDNEIRIIETRVDHFNEPRRSASPIPTRVSTYKDYSRATSPIPIRVDNAIEYPRAVSPVPGRVDTLNQRTCIEYPRTKSPPSFRFSDHATVGTSPRGVTSTYPIQRSVSAMSLSAVSQASLSQQQLSAVPEAPMSLSAVPQATLPQQQLSAVPRIFDSGSATASAPPAAQSLQQAQSPPAQPPSTLVRSLQSSMRARQPLTKSSRILSPALYSRCSF